MEALIQTFKIEIRKSSQAIISEKQVIQDLLQKLQII